MPRIAGFVLAGVGVVLLVLGINASQSFASDVQNFFTGNPTDKAMWLLIGGVALILGGGALALVPMRRA